MPTELKVLGLLWVLVALARGRIPGRAGSQEPGSNPDIGRGQAVTIAPPPAMDKFGGTRHKQKERAERRERLLL